MLVITVYVWDVKTGDLIYTGESFQQSDCSANCTYVAINQSGGGLCEVLEVSSGNSVFNTLPRIVFTMKLKQLIPMLNVSNIQASLIFYKDALGFEVVSDPEAIAEWRWATIRSGNTELMLSETGSDINLKKGIDPQKTTTWPVIFYFYPDSVVELYNHLVNLGYSPTELIDTIYGMKEFSLQDQDGHMLSFGKDVTK